MIPENQDQSDKDNFLNNPQYGGSWTGWIIIYIFILIFFGDSFFTFLKTAACMLTLNLVYGCSL